MQTAIFAIATSILAMLGLVAATPLTLPLKLKEPASHARLPRHQAGAASSSHNIGLKDYFNRTDNQWYSDISVGTPPQTLSVLWDTGSPYLLLPQSNCTSCGTHRLFNPANSSSFRAWPDTPINPLFATGADSIPFTQPEGATCHTVAIGDLSVPDQQLLLCDSYASVLDDQPIDGIIGLGVPSDDDSEVRPWFWNLFESGQLPSATFSFYTPAGSLDGAELTLGGMDQSKYKGDLAWTILSQGQPGAPEGWVVDHQAMVITSESTDKDGTPKNPIQIHNAPGDVGTLGWAVLDTGTAFIQTPDNATAARTYAQISPDITQIDPAGAWGAPCDSLNAMAPHITFTLGSGAWTANVTMPKSAFNLGEYPGKPGICQAVFNSGVPSFADDPTPIWILGSPLLKAYYTVWDGTNSKVGWGELAG
ncbi:aspartic peptidase domain-containing protein [Apiospora saccharicola]|uniref:Aspartic peptidase domain-containing protein n=1 Tax=Apiospora saccharicola TaxID=335842 RepID=A0ABR1TGS6_9PEZI